MERLAGEAEWADDPGPRHVQVVAAALAHLHITPRADRGVSIVLSSHLRTGRTTAAAPLECHFLHQDGLGGGEQGGLVAAAALPDLHHYSTCSARQRDSSTASWRAGSVLY